ncbi:MAG TPA: HNH endonuclease signature motif containing protein [Solirubrobacteraceae bacterium]|nr:HNH endonuclease signature motif containing protein [Solirubrobacteraceae bacterium]
MFREVKNPTFARRLTVLGRRYELRLERSAGSAAWNARQFRRLRAAQEIEPVALLAERDRRYWLFEDRVYWDDDELTAQDVLALVRDRERRLRRKLERARAGLAADRADASRRDPIPRAVRRAVFERDGGRCMACGSSFELQYDHVIPFSLGGASTIENLQILCADCNRGKGSSFG